MSFKNVLLLETIAEEAMTLLEAEKDRLRLFTAFGAQPLDQVLRENNIHAVITRGKGQCNAALMDACPELEVIARCGVGLDNVDVAEASRRKIKVINAPGSNSDTIAEHAITLMLMLQRNLYESAKQVKDGNWEWRNNFTGDEVNGKTLGILGLGNIGRKVARIAEVMGMDIIYWDKFRGESPYSYFPLEEVLQKADLLSLHLPLLDDTKNLIGEKELGMLKPTAILINTARGGLIDHAALLEALEKKQLAGFGADVLDIEPPAPDNPLTSHPRTIITAHVGSLTAGTYKKMCVSTVKNVLALLSGGQPETQSIFNRKALNLE